MKTKRQMVGELIRRIKDNHVVFDMNNSADGEFTIDAPADFWDEYPAGYYRPTDSSCLECDMSCLDESSLIRILADDKISMYMKFNDLMTLWDRAGYLETMPKLMDIRKDHIPVLRLRHNAYLYLVPGHGFRLCNDAYGNGFNTHYGSDLSMVKRIITPPKYSDEFFRDCETISYNKCRIQWNKRWAIFRKLVYLSCIFNSGMDNTFFCDMIRNNLMVFDEFVNKTDATITSFDLDTTLTIDMLRKRCSDAYVGDSMLFEIPVGIQDTENDKLKIAALLRYTDRSVSITWGDYKGEHQTLSAAFPAWDKDAWIEEAQGLDLKKETPYYPAHDDYLYYVWSSLSVALLGLAGFICNISSITLQSDALITLYDCAFWSQRDIMTNLEDIFYTLEDKCYMYPDAESLEKELSEEYLLTPVAMPCSIDPV